MTALGSEAVVRAHRIAKHADVIAALTLEALHGIGRAGRITLLLFLLLLLLL